MKINQLAILSLLTFAAELYAASPMETALVIAEMTAVHTNGNQIVVTAHVYSRNPAVKIKRIEYFMGSTNDVIYGQGIVLIPTGPAFNSTNMIASTRFAPTFRKGEFRDLFVHACGSDLKWTPFVKTSVSNVTVDDLMKKIQ